jgi:ABC-2 type transport system ATP-binding protein
MRKMGKKQLTLYLHEPIRSIPAGLSKYRLTLAASGKEIVYNYEQAEGAGIGDLLHDVNAAGIAFKDLHTTQSSLEEIFVGLLRDGR